MILVSVINAYLINLFSLFVRSKRNVSFILLLIVMIWIIWKTPNTVPDYINYYNSYYLGNDRYAWFYNVIRNVFVYFNLPFATFRNLILTFSMLISLLAVRNFTNKFNFYYLIYFLVPFFLDIIQIRNTVMFSFIFLGISFLVTPKKHNVILSLIFIILGCGFHTGGYFYLLIFPIYFISNRGKRAQFNVLRWIIPSILFLITVIALVTKHTAFFSQLVLHLSTDQQVEIYATRITNDSLLAKLLFIFTFSMMTLIANQMLTIAEKYNYDEKSVKIMKLIVVILVVASISLPLISIDTTFQRYFRNDISFLTIGIIILFERNIIVFKSIIIFIEYLICIGILIWLIIYKDIFENTVKIILGL